MWSKKNKHNRNESDVLFALKFFFFLLPKMTRKYEKETRKPI